MSKYQEDEIRSSTRYPCGAYVAQSKHFARPCRNQAVLLFKEADGTVKACACQKHRAEVRNALEYNTP